MLKKKGLVLDLRGVSFPAALARQLSDEFRHSPPYQDGTGKRRWLLKAIRMDHATVPDALEISNVAVANEISMEAAAFQELLYIGQSEVDTIDFGSFSQAQIKDLMISDVRAKSIRARKLTPSGKVILTEVIADGIGLGEAHFIDLVTLRLTCQYLHLADATFDKGFMAQVSDANIRLDRASLGSASILARRLADPYGRPGLRLLTADAGSPRLISFSGCDVSSLTLHNVDLRACRFWEGFGLDELTIEGRLMLSAAPARWHTHRKVISDEQLWRSVYGSAASKRLWTLPSTALPGYEAELRQAALDGDAPVTLGRWRAYTATSAKALRIIKNEPGAADFYYGEMEMRRRGAESAFENPLDRILAHLRLRT